MAEPVAALRISQLDAKQLDAEFMSLVQNQIGRILEPSQVSLLTRFQPEITAFVKFVIWRFSVCAAGATVGQQLMRLSYAQRAATTSTTTTTTWRKVSSTRRLIYGFVLIVVPWLRERLRAALEAIGGPATRGTERKVLQCVRWCEAGLGMASLINFALFLQTGSFPSLTERLLAITAVYPHRQHIRQVSYDYLTRELLWHGLSEFLSFLLPLVNVRRVRGAVRRLLLPSPAPSQPSSPDCRTAADLASCAACHLPPHNPRHIGCSHVFCYYCVTSNYLADPHYVCPVCRKAVLNLALISPLDLTQPSSEDLSH